MLKMKLTLCVFLALSFLAVVVLGSIGSESESEQSEPETTTEMPMENLQCRCSDFKTLENRIRALEKSHDKCKSLPKSYEKFEEGTKEQMKSMRKQVDVMNNKTRGDEDADVDVELQTPPLKEPPTKNGQQEEKESSEVSKNGGKATIGPKEDQDQRIPDPQSITSCSVAMEILPSPRSAKQWIYPHGNGTKVEIVCDFDEDGGGWTVIQKRSSGPKDNFNRTWDEYSNGFGSLSGNFWLGLENIHTLTKDGDQELRIELADFEGNKVYAQYSSFSISDASDFYRLNISGFSGTAGDSLNYHNRMRFSTKDKDKDLHPSKHCAANYGAWWHNACTNSALNGLYREKGETGWGIYWYSWKNNTNSLAKSVIKIRQRKSE